MRQLFSLLAFLLLPLSLFAQKTITIGSLLDEMISVEENARMPETDYQCLQSSSYDRHSVSPDQPGWFANDDGYGVIRVDTTRFGLERVMLDADGPGAIVRFWITAIDKHGTIRIYLDNAEEPTVTLPSYDLMLMATDGMKGGLVLPHTSYEANGKGGSTLFLPIPFQKHCKVTFTYKEGDDLTPRYYQINYRKYLAGTQVESYSKAQVARYSEKIKSVSQILQNPRLPEGLKSTKKKATLIEGNSLVLTLPKGQKGVYEISVEISNEKENYEQLARDIIVEATFDGQKTVEAPLSDFFCSGMGAREVKSFFTDADGKGHFTARWLMPYKKSASIRLINTSDIDICVSLEAKTKSLRWDERMLYFHALWHQQNNTPLRSSKSLNECIDWKMADLKGRGVYKGDMLTLFNRTRAWYGEGDEKIYVDGEKFPSHFGTGTEDYYNSSWAPVVVFQTPFGGAPREDLECSGGYNTFFRTRNLDGIPFHDSLLFTLEMLSWQNGDADVAATAFWYGDLTTQSVAKYPETKHYTLPQPPDDPAKYHREGAIEFEDAEVDNPEGLRTERQSMSAWPDYQWSGTHQYLCPNGKPGQTIIFTFSAPDEKAHDLLLYATKAADYGIISIKVNNSSKETIFNGFNEDVALTDAINLGCYSPVDGKYTIAITIKGTDDRSVGARYMWGMDCLVLSGSAASE